MAPIKIKLSLSSASIPNAVHQSTPAKASGSKSSTSTPKHAKAPKHARSGSHNRLPGDEGSEAGPSRLQGTTPLATAAPITHAGRASASAVETPATPIETPTRGSRAPKATSSSTKGKGKGKAKTAKRPTAIPTRLLSSTPSTPKNFLPLPNDDTLSPSGVSNVKEEEGEEGGDSLVASPATGDMQVDTPEPGDGAAHGDMGTPTTGQKSSVKWMRIKKPLRELATKIVVDLLRRDEVSLHLWYLDGVLMISTTYLDSLVSCC